MAFGGKEPIRTKIISSDRILEQVSHFNYLGNSIGYDGKYDIGVKLGKFQTIDVYKRQTLRYAEKSVVTI